MRVLALDTTTRAGSVAVVEDDRIVAPARRRSGAHARRAVAGGDLWPSSRAPASRCRPWTSSRSPPGRAPSPDCVSASRRYRALRSCCTEESSPCPRSRRSRRSRSGELPAGAHVGAWMDAHRREVFSACIGSQTRRSCARARLVEVDAAAVGVPASTMRTMERGPPHRSVIGDGAVLYKEMIGEPGCRVARCWRARLGSWRSTVPARARPSILLEVHPLYVRRPDVEIEAREGR